MLVGHLPEALHRLVCSIPVSNVQCLHPAAEDHQVLMIGLLVGWLLGLTVGSVLCRQARTVADHSVPTYHHLAAGDAATRRVRSVNVE